MLPVGTRNRVSFSLPGTLIAGLSLFMFVLVLGLLGLGLTPYDPLQLDFQQRLMPPGSEHWLGTDQYGRDVLSRLLSGASSSLGVSMVAVLIAITAGTLLGGIAGYLGGWTDLLISILVNAVLAFPGLLLALGIVSVIGSGIGGIALALGIALMPAAARVARAAVYSVKERGYVEASRQLGYGQAHILFRHVLPNCVSPLLIVATTILAICLLAESSLSFLGLGVAPPAPSWGGMLADGREYITQAPWLCAFPGLAIAVALLGLNLLGDGLRDFLDPRQEC